MNDFTAGALGTFLAVAFWGGLLIIVVGWLCHLLAGLWRAKAVQRAQEWSLQQDAAPVGSGSTANAVLMAKRVEPKGLGGASRSR